MGKNSHPSTLWVTPLSGRPQFTREIQIWLEDPQEVEESTSTNSTHTFGLQQIKAVQTWEEFSLRGEEMVVGIIDSGVDSNHPELAETNQSHFESQLREEITGQGTSPDQ